MVEKEFQSILRGTHIEKIFLIGGETHEEGACF
jgi:hypothetical protein